MNHTDFDTNREIGKEAPKIGASVLFIELERVLQLDDAHGLRAFLALFHAHLNALPLIQRAVALTLDGGPVDKDVSILIARDAKTGKPFAGATVFASMGTRDHARVAIQLLSPEIAENRRIVSEAKKNDEANWEPNEWKPDEEDDPEW